MKKLFRIMMTAAFAAVLCASSCEKSGKPAIEVVKFGASPSSFGLASWESSVRLSVRAGGHWEITCDKSWLHAVPSEGDGSAEVTVTAEANPADGSRTASLKVSCGASTFPVSVSQTGRGESVLIDSSDGLKDLLKGNADACNYAVSVTATDDGFLLFGFKDGVKCCGVVKGSVPVFAVGDDGSWIADGVPTPAKADKDALRSGSFPEVTESGGNIAIDGAGTGIAAPSGSPVGLRCVLNTGKFLCFCFAEGGPVSIGFETEGVPFNPPLLPVGDDDTLKILFIGNSYTHDATEHLPGLLNSAGIKNVKLVRAFHGGYTLPGYFTNYENPNICTHEWCNPGATEWHNDYVTFDYRFSPKDVVESDTWDIVTLQEYTANPRAWTWDDAEKEAIGGLCERIREWQPRHRPTICYLMSQVPAKTYKESNSDVTFYPKYWPNQLSAYRAVVQQVQKIVDPESGFGIDIVIPTGTTVQNLRTSSLNIENGQDLSRDGHHLDKGITRYAAAATVFEMLLKPCKGVSVEGNTYRFATEDLSATNHTTPVTDDNAPIAVKAAQFACQNPFEVTDMSSY